MRSKLAFTGTVAAVALSAGLAFFLGARAGVALNGRVMAVSVARVPMPLLAAPGSSPVHTHVR